MLSLIVAVIVCLLVLIVVAGTAAARPDPPRCRPWDRAGPRDFTSRHRR